VGVVLDGDPQPLADKLNARFGSGESQHCEEDDGYPRVRLGCTAKTVHDDAGLSRYEKVQSVGGKEAKDDCHRAELEWRAIDRPDVWEEDLVRVSNRRLIKQFALAAGSCLP